MPLNEAKATKTIAILGEDKHELDRIKKSISMHCRLKKDSHIFARGIYAGYAILLLEIGHQEEDIDYKISHLIMHYQIDFAIFIGFVGALKEDIAAGDVVIPLEFRSLAFSEERYYASPGLVSLAKRLTGKSGLTARVTKINLTVDRVYFKDDKIKLTRAKPEIFSLDMVSFFVAKAFYNHQIDFIVIKGVSDGINFYLRDFDFLFKAKYQISLVRLLLYCVRYPREIIRLCQFIQGGRKATKNNIAFLKDFLKAV
ncbi:MAG: hypothetical protein Q7K98_00705 [Candidatus Omnitrophota bacterium]|nr:hypothetical protein [Candidatus Omnitrophota bacterium]